ncbi:MAG: hypothetical protein ACOZAR_03665, partial [Patescibacteria group bacterium]
IVRDEKRKKGCRFSVIKLDFENLSPGDFDPATGGGFSSGHRGYLPKYNCHTVLFNRTIIFI